MLLLTGLLSLLLVALSEGGSPYRNWVIAAGIDCLALALAGLGLLRIFPQNIRDCDDPKKRSPRSVESPAADELRAAIVQHLAPDQPVNIIFEAHHREAEHFAKQIADFLHGRGFKVAEVLPEPNMLPLLPGVGVTENNRVLVGPNA
jgi:hypothetical protein